MATNLDLDLDGSKFYLSESTEFVRVHRYPQCSMIDEIFGIKAHTDSSVLSILRSEPVGGLEVFKDGKWLQVEHIPNTLIANLGDMMQAISDDKYKSMNHRVKIKENKERLSICYFVFPEETFVIKSSKYKPFTYRDFQKFVQQDIKIYGSKQLELERFKNIDQSLEPAT